MVLVVFPIKISTHHFLFYVYIQMNLKIQKRFDKQIPEIEWTDEENDLVFTPESLNFNTFIRAFSKNKLQRQFLEHKICDFYLVENGDVRLCEKRPNILTDESKLRQNVWRVCRLATNILLSVWQK